MVNVLARRELARGITAALGIHHESPQALLWFRGQLRWHDSHSSLTAEAFEREVQAVWRGEGGE